MTPAPDLSLLTPGLAFWHAYDPASKSELFSTALSPDGDRLLLIDPIPLTPAAYERLLQLGRPAGVIVTNENHWRASSGFASEFNLPIFARLDAVSPLRGPVRELRGDETALQGCAIISIEGAAAGEVVLFSPADGGTLVAGDSLIHFDPHGLALLPKKYCANQKQMRESLRQLLGYNARRILFAHGLPIVRETMARLGRVLSEE